MRTRVSCRGFVLLLALFAFASRLRAEGTVIFDMDTIRHKPTPVGKEKTPAGTVELVEGKVGKACKLTFIADASGGFFTGGVPKLLAKLKAKQPVTIVTMGDSLTDKRHWANRQVVWAEVFAAKLKETYGSEVTLVNVSRGGSQLTHGLLGMPLWLRDAPEPDLVTVWYGFNDWSDGMRGEQFQSTLAFAVDRIRRLTKGKSEVLLITTCPAFERWDTMDEMAGAIRIVAMKKKAGLADVAAAFKKSGGDEAARLKLFCSDKTHLGADGHNLAAETLVKAIAE